MKVRILHAGKYSDFSTPPVRGAKHRREGDVVEFPKDYAQGIVASGLAEPVVEADVAGGEELGVEQEAKPIDATPGAKALVKELNAEREHKINLATVQGTGTGGRITMRDVEKLE